jgi:hypothetical protein
VWTPPERTPRRAAATGTRRTGAGPAGDNLPSAGTPREEAPDDGAWPPAAAEMPMRVRPPRRPEADPAARSDPADRPWFRRTRGRVVIGVAAVALVAAAAVGLLTRTIGIRPPVPAASPHAPTAVSAKAHGGAVTIAWQDPSGGTAPFIVAGGVAGQTATVHQQVPAGQTSITVNGLNAKSVYCFTVVAVYGTNVVAVSALACTGHA